MKSNYLLVAILLLATSVKAQIFVQKLGQDQLQMSEKLYIVTNAGDTLYGKIASSSLADGLMTRFTFIEGDVKTKYEIEQITALGIIPSDAATYDDAALVPALKEMKNEEFIKVLPPDGWVYFERIQLPGKRERYQLSQVRNPGFDNKVKVYSFPEADDSGSSSINGLTLTGAQDNTHYVAINGERPFEIGSLGYKKKALEMIYNNCTELSDMKLKWSDFAKHVFTYDQKCD